ncbi:MAG: type II toxin-antitoxin system HicA family toxin [Bryobacteraceae bacterium]
MTSDRPRSARRFLPPPSKFMPKHRVPRLTASETEAVPLKAGFAWLRSKGSHRIYENGGRRVVVPFHGGVTLTPQAARASRSNSSGPLAVLLHRHRPPCPIELPKRLENCLTFRGRWL